MEHPLENWDALDDYKAPDPLEQMNWEELGKALEDDRNAGLPAAAWR